MNNISIIVSILITLNLLRKDEKELTECKKKNFCTVITELLIELFQLLMTSQYSYLLIYKQKEKIILVILVYILLNVW